LGIIEEGQDVMKEFKGAPTLDAGLLAAAQAAGSPVLSPEKLHRAKQAGSKALPKRVDAWLKTRTETHQERREAHGRGTPAPRQCPAFDRIIHLPLPSCPNSAPSSSSR